MQFLGFRRFFLGQIRLLTEIGGQVIELDVAKLIELDQLPITLPNGRTRCPCGTMVVATPAAAELTAGVLPSGFPDSILRLD